MIVYRLVLTPPGGDGPVAAWHIREVLRDSDAGWEVVHANIAWDGSFGAPPPMPSDPAAPG